jgi:hypothetical protein
VEPVVERLLLPPREEELREPALPLLVPLPARAQESSAVARANKPAKASTVSTAVVFRGLLNGDMKSLQMRWSG